MSSARWGKWTSRAAAAASSFGRRQLVSLAEWSNSGRRRGRGDDFLEVLGVGGGGGEGGAQDVAKVGGVDPGHHDGEGGATRRCVVKLRGINRSV